MSLQALCSSCVMGPPLLSAACTLISQVCHSRDRQDRKWSFGKISNRSECCKQFLFFTFYPERGARNWSVSSGPHCAAPRRGGEARVSKNSMKFLALLCFCFISVWLLQLLNWFLEFSQLLLFIFRIISDVLLLLARWALGNSFRSKEFFTPFIV